MLTTSTSTRSAADPLPLTGEPSIGQVRLDPSLHNRQRRHSRLGMLTPVEFETRHQTETVA